MAEGELLREAGRLIALGLMPKRRPSNDEEYARLVRRFLDEPDFENALRAIAAGLGLEVLDVSEFGIVLGAGADSPFGLTVADYRSNMSKEERLLHGLVQVGLAAYLYPRAEDLESDAEVRQVSVNDLDDYLRDQCEALRQKKPESADAPVDQPELERALQIYLRWPSTKKTADGRRAAKTTQGIIAHALTRLEQQGLLRHVGDQGGDTYQALRRYRVQVRELAAHQALRALRNVRKEKRP
jgi:hypothetical protein